MATSAEMGKSGRRGSIILSDYGGVAQLPETIKQVGARINFGMTSGASVIGIGILQRAVCYHACRVAFVAGFRVQVTAAVTILAACAISLAVVC